MVKIDKSYFYRGISYLKKNLLFLNVKNKNVRDLAYKDYCYKKLYKKYKYVIDNYKEENIKKFSDFVWICWFQGVDNAPPLVKSCINSVKKNIPNKKVIVLDNTNIDKYVEFPDYIIKKRKKGLIGDALYSDLIRLQLLNKYGGLWVDSTVYMTDTVKDEFFEQELFVFKEISLFQKEELPIRASNWLIYSCSNNNILMLTERLLLEYWKREKYPRNYYIFHLFFSMATKKYSDDWKKVSSFSNINNHILQFELLEEYNENRWEEIKNIAIFHKLNRRIFTDDKKSNYYHIIEGKNLNE